MGEVMLHHDLDLRDPRAVAKSIRLHCAVMPDCEVTLNMTCDTALALADMLHPSPEPVAHVPRLHLDLPAGDWPASEQWDFDAPLRPNGPAILILLVAVSAGLWLAITGIVAALS